MRKLRLAIMGQNKKNLDDLKHMDGSIGVKLVEKLYLYTGSEFVHTSDLESLNSLILKYCNKTYVYRLLLHIYCYSCITFSNSFSVGWGCSSGAVLQR